MKTCPVCDAPYTDETSHCPTDGAALIRSQELELGRAVRGKYRILSKIGQGGMGQVYLAEHLMLGGKLALKFLAPELSQSPRFIKRFRLEAKAAYQLKHPNIVEVLDLDQDENGTLFIAMEYVQGASLRSVINRCPSGIPAVAALNFARDVASGLAAAHARGIIHRDIKPENILIAHQAGEVDRAKVLDFGIAAMSEGITDVSRTHGVLLTPEYASPEQWRGMPASELDCRADLYALGGVLYEMLAGQRVYQAANSEGWMFQHLNGDFTALADSRPDIESQFGGISQIVDQLLAREREDRPSCADVVVEELDRILDESGSAPMEPDGPGATLFEEVDSHARSTGPRSGDVRSGSRRSGMSGESARHRASGPQRTTGQRDSRRDRASGEWNTGRIGARTSRRVEPEVSASRPWTGRLAIGAGILLALIGGGFAWLHFRPLPATVAPILLPPPGVFSDALQVQLSDSMSGAVIHFTTDGSAPSESSPTYSGAIPVNSGEVHLRAIAVANGHSASAEAEGIYLISPGAQGSAGPKPSPSSPVPAAQSGSQPATAKPPAPAPTKSLLATTNSAQIPAADHGTQANSPAQVNPPVQPVPQNTTPARPRVEPASERMQEISTAASEAMILSRTMPAYPPAAQARGVSGTVVLKIVISATGNVTKIDPVSGPPELQRAAMDAVRTWRYRPFEIRGQAVPVSTYVRVAFNLR